MSRSFIRDKRGVSEIIASLIIILIAAVAGVALYSYSLSAFSSSSNSFQIETSQKEERARERLLITTVWNSTSDYMNVTVLNYGKNELVIDAVYINGIQVSASAYTDGRGVPVAKGNLISVKFTSPVSIVSGQSYEIIVVGERGSRDVVYWEV